LLPRARAVSEVPFTVLTGRQCEVSIDITNQFWTLTLGEGMRTIPALDVWLRALALVLNVRAITAPMHKWFSFEKAWQRSAEALIDDLLSIPTNK